MLDVRLAVRKLFKHPRFAVIAMTTLALVVGANTAIFSVVKAVLLNQLPYRDPDRLVTIAETTPATLNPPTSISPRRTICASAARCSKACRCSAAQAGRSSTASNRNCFAACADWRGLAGGVCRRFRADVFFVNEERPADLATWSAVSVALTVVGLMASYIPARQAMRVDQMIALRQD
jgi:hypothetical protein